MLHKLFSLILSSLFIFTFVVFAQGDCPKKNIAKTHVKEFLPLFSSSVIISSLTFNPLIHSEGFFFFYGVKKLFLFFFFFCMCLSSFPNTIYCICPIVYSCFLCHRLVVSMGWFLGSLFRSIDLCLFLCQYHSFVQQFEIREHDTFNFVLSQYFFGYSGPFVVLYKL